MLVDFSGSPHGGKTKLLPEAYKQTQITPVGIVDHSIVGSGLGAYYYFRDLTGSESTFINNLDGELWQLMPCDRRADAQVDGNLFTLDGLLCGLLSIEHADNGDPDNFAFTRAQLDSDIWLHDKLARRFNWPRRRCSAPTGDGARGLGFHSMWLDTRYMRPDRTQPWTTAAGKTCPGRPVRVRQWETILLPAFINGTPTQEDPMAAFTEADIRRFVQEETRRELKPIYQLLGYGDSRTDRPDEPADTHPYNLQAVSAKLDKLLAAQAPPEPAP
jgi:hypothetical protein